MRLISIFRTIGTKMLKIPRWNPIESFILGATLFSGVAGIFDGQNTSQIVLKELPYWIVITWYICITMGSAITLYGLHAVKYFWAYLGYFFVGPISVVYALTIMSTGQTPLAYSVVLTFVFGLAGIARGLQLFNLLKKVGQEVE
jgi:hypothetical protein